MKLIKYEDNWADEIDIVGLIVMKDETWKETQEKISNYEDSFTIGVGSNEEISYNNGEALLGSLEVSDITLEQCQWLYKVIHPEGKNYEEDKFDFGMNPIEQILDIINYNEEE